VDEQPATKTEPNRSAMSSLCTMGSNARKANLGVCKCGGESKSLPHQPVVARVAHAADR
jgi:hypothetical protein